MESKLRPNHLRFVGATELPKFLSGFDVEQAFRISAADIAAIRERIRADRRFGVRSSWSSFERQDAPWIGRQVCPGRSYGP